MITRGQIMSDDIAGDVTDSKIGGADTILTELFRAMKHDLNVSEALLEVAVQRFSMKVADVPDHKKLLGAKSNFLSALNKNTMTFKTLHRGILILGAKKYKISITGKRPDGSYAIASKTLEVSNKDFIDSKDEVIETFLLDMFKQLNHLSVENTKDFGNLFEDYASIVGILPDNISRSKERASLKKDLFKAKKLSWKNFVKGLLFLGFTEFDIVISISHKSGKLTTHSRKIILREKEDKE